MRDFLILCAVVILAGCATLNSTFPINGTNNEVINNTEDNSSLPDDSEGVINTANDCASDCTWYTNKWFNKDESNQCMTACLDFSREVWSDLTNNREITYNSVNEFPTN